MSIAARGSRVSSAYNREGDIDIILIRFFSTALRFTSLYFKKITLDSLQLMLPDVDRVSLLNPHLVTVTDTRPTSRKCVVNVFPRTLHHGQDRIRTRELPQRTAIMKDRVGVDIDTINYIGIFFYSLSSYRAASHA